MLQERQIAFFYATKKAMHREMERGIIVFHGTNEFSHAHLDGQFLAQFANESPLVRLPAFNFPSREFPKALVIAITALCSQINGPGVVFLVKCIRGVFERFLGQNTGDDFNLFHTGT